MFNNSKSIIFGVCLIAVTVVFVTSVNATVDISQIPLDAQTKAAPANIMFVLDDSGSMDWEMMTIESNGLFSNQYYVFDNPGDNLYSANQILTDVQRLMWKSQWFEHNKMYYNPEVTYTPWPMLATNPWQNGTLGADPDNPRSHPFIAGNTFNLSSTYVQLFPTPPLAADIIVDNQDGGFSIVSGTWNESGASPEHAGSSFYSGSNPASARWTINVPTADNYQVWIYWSSVAGWSRDTAAQYVVNHVGGPTTYVRDQTQNFGDWNLLGSHPFGAGPTTIAVVHSNSNTSADAVRLIQGAGAVITIPRAHYYVYSTIEARPYLVTIDGGSINYYAVTVTGTGSTESVTNLQLNANPPADVQSSLTYTEARQNFANWYSFYRRRELTATAAVSNVISQMAGVQIGISTINNTINQPVLQVKVDGIDQTNSLLSTLYGMVLPAMGTPLRTGLQDVGRYFHADDGNTGGIGTCPYWSAANGGECQQAFAIVMTDGYWNGGSPGVGNVDGTSGNPFQDGFSDTLADVAMQYWQNDLSAGLTNLISPSSVDSATWQHMVTYGVSFGVIGTLDPANYDLTASPAPNIPWPNPTAGNQQKIDDLYHASVDGHGTFLNATNPSELVNSLLDIMLDIKQRIGSAASVSVNGDNLFKLIDNDTYLFQSSYNTTGWLGDVRSYKVDSADGSIDMANPEWSTADVWQAENWTTYWNSRSITTYNGASGVPFRIGSLTAAQEALLDPVPATAQLVLNYVRGDSTEEQFNGGTFRNRSGRRLGDIVHSSPVYHRGILYVGANDGMMHAIRAEGANAGSEVFSYVPSQVIQNLPLLTDPAYAHNYYVDSTVTVKDNVLGANSTLLVGGLGQGGKGYYALDISNLSTYNTVTHRWQASAVTEASVAGKVLWEFPHAGATPTAAADLTDIGSSFSKAYIRRSNDPSHPWVVIFGNGYNSVDGQSVLFVLDPANGDVLRKFELGGNIDRNGDGDFLDSGDGNGLATPSVVDVNGDGKADYVYAGDLGGNMWKIDLTGSTIANWEVAFAQGGVIAPLFKAVGPTGVDQPITARPAVMFHPQYHGYTVVFGTGKFLGTSDFLNTDVQTVYGVWDYGDDTDDAESLGTFDHATEQISEQSSRTTLLEQELLVPDFTYDPDPLVTGDEKVVRVLTDNHIVWATAADSTAGELPDFSTTVDNNAGWYFDLPNSGERVVSRMMIRGGKAIYISFTPQDSPCSTGGSSVVHLVDAADGGRVSEVVIDINNDGFINAMDQATVVDGSGNTISATVSGLEFEGFVQPPAIIRYGDGTEGLYMSSTTGGIAGGGTPPRVASPDFGVLSWREF